MLAGPCLLRYPLSIQRSDIRVFRISKFCNPKTSLAGHLGNRLKPISVATASINTPMIRVAVIGGGLSGLSCARKLTELGVSSFGSGEHSEWSDNYMLRFIVLD